MRDVLILLTTTIITAVLWRFIDINRIYVQQIDYDNALEISLPIDGTTDIQYLKDI